MAKTAVVLNKKGGVGKTTITDALALIFAEVGKTVLIDNDPQGNSSSIFASQEYIQQNTSASLYLKPAYITAYPATQRISLKTEDRVIIDNLFISTAAKALEQIQVRANATTLFSLKNAIKKAGDDYDFFVIDSPPNGGIAQSSALFAADYIFVPMIADSFSIEAVDELFADLQEILEQRDEMPVISLFWNQTTYNARSSVERFSLLMSNKYPDYFTDISVPFQQKVRDAASGFYTIPVYAKLQKFDPKPYTAIKQIVKHLNIIGDRDV